MTIESLKAISDGMAALGLSYAFMRWEGEKKDPYFVGEYQEVPMTTEDGMQETDFILTGRTRGSWLDLETAKKQIEEYFHPIYGKRVSTETTGLAITYENGFAVPSVELELKKIEIHLNVKEWKVI